MTDNDNTKLTLGSRDDRKAVEDGLVFAPRFDENGLIPAIATDAGTGEVLMMAFMNDISLARTLELGEAVYWSRSRQKIWHKGETSGHVQRIVEIRTDCDQDCLWMRVEQVGPGCCHTGHRSCFYRRLPGKDEFAARDPEQPVTLSETGGGKAFDAGEVYGN